MWHSSREQIDDTLGRIQVWHNAGEERRGEAHCMRLNSQTVRQAFYTDMHLPQHILQEQKKPKKHPYQTVYSAGCQKPQHNPVKHSVTKQNKGAHTYIFFPPACERMRVHGSPIPKPSEPRPPSLWLLMPRLYCPLLGPNVVNWQPAPSCSHSFVCKPFKHLNHEKGLTRLDVLSETGRKWKRTKCCLRSKFVRN